MRQAAVTTARKTPRQERSRNTVEAILAATARVLVQDGFERATTNRIAAVAGVSVGSLYQYFPNKGALVRALYDRHLAEAERIRPAALQNESTTSRDRPPLRDVIRSAVDWHVAIHAREPDLHRELTRHANQILGAKLVVAFENAHEAAVYRRLVRHRRELRPRNVAIAAFLVATCLEAVAHAAAARHPELLHRGEVAGELTSMIVRYLQGGAAEQRRSPRRPRRGAARS